MTLGTSLFLMTILVLSVFAAREVSRRKKWRLILKILVVIFVVSLAVGIGIWKWNIYKDRPQPITSLGALSLGMTPVEVTLAAGKPTFETTGINVDGHPRYLYKDYVNEIEYFVKFSQAANLQEARVETICSQSLANKFSNLGKYSTESEVREKLGEPTKVSINEDGLRKMMSYNKWNVAFEIEKGSVSSLCVTSTGAVEYVQEYGEATTTTAG